MGYKSAGRGRIATEGNAMETKQNKSELSKGEISASAVSGNTSCGRSSAGPRDSTTLASHILQRNAKEDLRLGCQYNENGEKRLLYNWLRTRLELTDCFIRRKINGLNIYRTFPEPSTVFCSNGFFFYFIRISKMNRVDSVFLVGGFSVSRFFFFWINITYSCLHSAWTQKLRQNTLSFLFARSMPKNKINKALSRLREPEPK